MRTSVIALLMVSTASLALAQQPTNPNLERIANDAYTRSHDYDIVHQRIAVSNFNWDSTSFKGSVATTLVSRLTGLDSVILDAGARLGIRGVMSEFHTALRQTRHGDTLVVHLPAPVAFGDTVRFSIDYDGRVDNGMGLTFIDERPHTPRQIWSQGEGMNNHFWFPTYDFPNDKMTWELDATVPAGYTAVSNGALTGDTRGAGGTHTMHWNQSTPSATYLVSLIVAPLAKVHDTWRDVPVDAYVYHQDSALARPLFHITSDMIDVYSQLTGVDYPWAKYAQTTVADFFGGMENVSATTLVDWLPDARAYRDRPWYQYILIPHELAHQWFGDYVTTENWANMWLNEGFAEFMPGQYWARKLGEHAEQDYYADEYRQYMAIESRRPMPLASDGSNNIYPKGALVIKMMKDYLGDARFWAGINRYLTEHAYDGATTDDMRQAILDATGQNLDWFFREWIYSAGHPSFTVTSNYDAQAHKLTLAVQQTQRDSLEADSSGLRYPIPEAFTMPVVVRVGTNSGDVIDSTWIRQRADTIVIDSVMSAPTMIVFDDGNHILKSLTFEQPTAALATQLQRDSNLWNREWVIDQLSTRPTDAAAAAALAAAATSADYFDTRRLAATALGNFPAASALPALERALRDSSALVRAAAVGALGNIGGARALELSRSAWEGDSSYTVRAAALTSITRLDASGRAAAIRQGLTTPSYRDAIQNAALVAIVGTNDTTLIADVQRLIGEQSLPARVLGALAARGSARALEVLTSDLNDPRSYVREWALAGFSSLPPSRRVTALRAAVAGLKYADTKDAVQQMIERLGRQSAGPE